jgi:hypothetical protein
MAKKTNLTIVETPISESERIEHEESLEIGQWYWVKEEETEGWDDEKDEPLHVRTVEWLGCIVYVGSNYVKIGGINCSQRVHIEDEFDELCRREPNPEAVIRGKVAQYQDNVRKLMGDIKQLTAKLGLTPKGELAEENQDCSQALVVAHGTKDIKAHKEALIKAKEETLPDLFKQVREQHERMAEWMSAELIPMKAETEKLREQTEVIEDRIFTVELYAGLVEEMVQVKKGKPASNDEKIHLFQRRHYMDEECLVAYEAGGMKFKNLRAFDRWLCRKKNLNRILPYPKCVVAFRVRRKEWNYETLSLRDFINIALSGDPDKSTFLYIRNGQQVFRLSTGIDFGKQLFPDRDHSIVLGDAGGSLYMETSWHGVKKIISEGEYEEIMKDHMERLEKWSKEHAEWEAEKKKPKSKRKKNLSHFGPHKPFMHDRWEPCTPDSVYYDDAMKLIARRAMEHNRVAVVLQGILDRSPALHPHPPWKLWTPEGFTNAIELVYDQTRALTDGDAPDFEAYRARLNSTIKKGTMTVGQEDYWERVEAEKENERERCDYRIRHYSDYKRFQPYGDPGPGLVAKVARFAPRKGVCTFEWERQRKITKWVPNPKRPGYLMVDESGVKTTIKVPISQLLNVDAYTPGDFRQFYADPRTRADYLRWAPLMLAAEDYHAGKKRKPRRRTVFAGGMMVESCDDED